MVEQQTESQLAAHSSVLEYLQHLAYKDLGRTEVILPENVVEQESHILDWIYTTFDIDEDPSDEKIAEAAYFLCNSRDIQSRDRCSWFLWESQKGPPADEKIYALLKRYQGRKHVRYFLDGNPALVAELISLLGQFYNDEEKEIDELRIVIPREMFDIEEVNEFVKAKIPQNNESVTWVEEKHSIVSRMVGDRDSFRAQQEELGPLESQLDNDRFDIQTLKDYHINQIEELLRLRHPASGFRSEYAVANELHKVIVERASTTDAENSPPEIVCALAGAYGNCNITFSGCNNEGRNLYLLGDTVRDDRIVGADGKPVPRLGEIALYAVMEMIFEKDPTAIVVTDTISEKSTHMCNHLGMRVVKEYIWINYRRDGTPPARDSLED